MPLPSRRFAWTRAHVLILGILMLLSGSANGAPNPARRDAPRGLREVLADLLASEDSPAPGRLIAALRVLGRLPIPAHPSCPGLVCPPGPVPTDEPFPTAPYDPKGNDCALVGRTGEIEAYLKTLTGTVETCLDHAERSHAAAVAARAQLDDQVDRLPVGWIPGLDSGSVGVTVEGIDLAEERLARADGGAYFTEWLRALTESAGSLCENAHETYAPIERACAEMNVILCGQDGLLWDERQRANFHVRLDAALRESLVTLERVRGRTALFGRSVRGFLDVFSEDAIECRGAKPDTDAELRVAVERAYHRFLKDVRTHAKDLRHAPATLHAWIAGRYFRLALPAAVLRELFPPPDPAPAPPPIPGDQVPFAPPPAGH